MKNIHETQRKILDFIRKNGGSLKNFSLRDVGEEIGIGRKPQVVAHHINQLQKTGVLRLEDEAERKYTILDNPVSSVEYINLYSCTAECGPNGLLGHDTVIDKIPLPTKTFGITKAKDFFLIKARGDSMEPMIKEGDLVLGKVQADIPSSGSIAIVVHENMPKIKKFLIENIGGQTVYCLESLNRKYDREFISDESEGLRVVGLVKSVISKPKAD